MTGRPSRARLLYRLLIVPVLAILGVLVLVWLAVDYLAADYFMTLMQEYNVDAAETNEMFLAATHRALLWAAGGGLLLAITLSYVLTRRLLRPLTQMIAVTRALASGDYSARVTTSANDEIGELGRAFDRMASRLQEVDRLRKTMLVDVAHELRTPLTNVRGYLEALKDGVLAPSPEAFSSLHDETLRLVKLVEDLLALARAEAAGPTLRREQRVLEDLVERTVQLFRPQLAAKQIEVQRSFDTERFPIEVDPDKIAQALHNLLANAVSYTPERGRVRVAVEHGVDEVRFTCSNTGAGIPPADLPLIFERLYRVDRSRSRAGSGLGLAIVRQLVEAHGGRVGAASEGGETHVWFSLPTVTESLPGPYASLTPQR
jgi:two-component system sensor histidine kinase BaeS